MNSTSFDPSVTPYQVDFERFPRQGWLDEQFRFLLRYAILAPSSHNAQPWKFRVFNNGIAVYADYTRRLPVSDPDNRELLMSIGAAIMNLGIAALHFGFSCRVDYNYSGDSELPVAFVTLSQEIPAQTPDPLLERLFLSITKRHTNRHPFLMARVPDSLLHTLSEGTEGSEASIITSTDPQKNTQVARLVAKAERSQQANPEFRKELGEWLRPNKTLKTDGMPGAAFGISDLGSALAPWAVKKLDMGAFRARHDERLCIEAPALCVFHSEDSVPAWLAVGELLERVLLMLTRDGLQCSFFNMPVEVPDVRLELRELLGVPSWPQLLVRIGYSLEKPTPSPRRAVEECIV